MRPTAMSVSLINTSLTDIGINLGHDSFDADRPGTGAKVEEAGALDPGGEHVEQGLAEPVGGGPRSGIGRAFQHPAAVFAGDDSHMRIV